MQTDVVLLFVFLLLYLYSIMQYSCTISVFFSRGSVASTCSMLLYLVMYFITLADTGTKAGNIGISLLPPVAFSKGMALFADSESAQIGISFANMFSTVSADPSSLSMGEVP